MINKSLGEFLQFACKFNYRNKVKLGPALSNGLNIKNHSKQGGYSTMITFQKNQDYFFKQIKGESILLNPQTGDYFGLNEVGTDFMKLADEGKNLDQIIANLFEIYDVEEPVLRKDIMELINDLQLKGILM